ncbi:XRE family transcriptional regulator [Bacillus sp. HMF5848]|uniref:helix-turn-helix domain-containing protein n=1 Tax=Bacillus sp. HMF5848 TaxID=2495421 RepID=UPI000F76DDAE|nr:helix-turn-helix domain-containing protein [Bacillus sp. HMF5848]RSK25854.1 XRE family transcriptional regulator [Bacillus sp. HMF5848]
MISTNLKSLRKISKYTQEDVADKVGVSRQAVAKWENGETVPDINNCIALAELYGVTLDDLVNYPDEEEGMGIRPKGKHIFGIVKVGDRGQIVIPKKAREIFAISPGDSLLVLGDEAQGIAIVKSEGFLQFAQDVFTAQQYKEEEE